MRHQGIIETRSLSRPGRLTLVLTTLIRVGHTAELPSGCSTYYRTHKAPA